MSHVRDLRRPVAGAPVCRREGKRSVGIDRGAMTGGRAASLHSSRWGHRPARVWPDVPLSLFGPGEESGTFDYFTEAVMGKAKSSRGDFTASEDDSERYFKASHEERLLNYL